MNFFDEATLRLKQQLNVMEDQEVARSLGLTKNAWAMRKKRGNFPDTELYALSARRPDLNLDVDYILNGDKSLMEIIDRFLDYCGFSSAEADEKLGLRPGTVAKALAYQLLTEPRAHPVVSVTASGKRSIAAGGSVTIIRPQDKKGDKP
jgi:transcriptional regulator with XRE-family HTH domain